MNDHDHVHFCEECEKEFPLSGVCFNKCSEHEPHSCVCDFCSSEKVRWAYPAEDFLIGAIAAVDPDTGKAIEVQPMGSKGPWAACDACAECIERGDYEALRQRGFDAIPVDEVVDMELAKTMLTNMHLGFKQNRTGPRTEVA
jgi:hypothetical protein